MRRGASGRAGIDCPIDLFGPTKREIEEITASINQAQSPAAKAPLASELRRTVGKLLSCTAYDPDNANCRLCQEVSQLRDKTAALVERAAGLDR